MLKPLLPVLFSSLLAVTWSSVANMMWLFTPSFPIWPFSIVFFILLTISLVIVRKFNTDPEAAINRVMSQSVARLILSGIAFAAFQYFFQERSKELLIHFVPHYFIFTLSDIVGQVKQPRQS
jgi:hypothetical protein